MKISLNKFAKVGTMALTAVGFASTAIAPLVHAVDPAVTGLEQNSVICRIFPFLNSITLAASICGTPNGTEIITTGQNLVTLALQLVFVGIIVISIYIIIRAAVKYIRSEGDESKIQEAQKAIKSVFIGIAALFIGIIGIVIILAFFQGTGVVIPTTVTAP
ncbi:MAG: hypothetical protein ACMG57_01880 [Candidatus Dojkabacteria bacterium]